MSPIYDFRCLSCEEKFEALVSPDEIPECPKCQSTRIEKLVSGFARYGIKGDNSSSRTPKNQGLSPEKTPRQKKPKPELPKAIRDSKYIKNR